MARFQFRLASVLRFRERLKEEKQWDLRALNEAKQRMENQIHALEQELQHAGEVMAGHDGEVFAAIDLRLHSDYACVLALRIKDECRALEQLEQKLVEKREELMEAMRGVKILEQLRKRREERFRREQEIEERKMGDETGQRKFSDPNNRQKLP